MRAWATGALALILGCGSSTKSTTDAMVAELPIDAAPPDAAPPDAMPSAIHTYYLNFEGQAITLGNDDPVNNKSTIPTKAYTVPPFLMNDAQRTTKIAAIVTEVQAVLAPYDITVTTTRPSSGTYDMLVAGGLSSDAGIGNGIGSIVSNDCMGGNPHVMFLFEAVTEQHADVAETIAMLAVAQGMPQADKAGDCLCYSGQKCTALTGVCTIGGPDTPVLAAQSCNPAVTKMDENGEWLAVFGAHK